MDKSEKTTIWESPEELASVITQGYSVTDKEKIRAQYLEQVKQYPLYGEWFDRIDAILRKLPPNRFVIEYGSGPGILAGRLKDNPNVGNYIAIEPNETFREMTAEQNPKAIILKEIAETYMHPDSADVVVETGAYHHMHDKPKALQNMFANLRKDGKLIFADVFLPNYGFDEQFMPTDKKEFFGGVMRYAAAQIKSMLSPSEADIEDQIRTAFLDALRIEELKVCTPILQKQLEQTGFKNIAIELMTGDNPNIDYKTLGWYFITADK